VGQRVHVLFDVLLAFEAFSHRCECAAEVAEFADGIRGRYPLVRGHCIGIAAQRAKLA